MNHDELGQEALRKRTATKEDEYFARQNKAKMEEEAARKRREEQKRIMDEQKTLHWMHCPKCGNDLEEIPHEGIMIDRCKGCGGIWLDPGELEFLEKKEEGFWGRLLGRRHRSD